MSLRQKINAQVAADGITVLGHVTEEYATILTPEALRFVAKLQRAHNGRRLELMQRRYARSAYFTKGVANAVLVF